MKLETFFDKFDQFADAPNAVARMRALVLELAVRGSLTEQVTGDQNDPRWHELTAMLDARGDSIGLLGDCPFEIPDSWRWVTLNDLGETKPRNNLADTEKASFVPMALVPAEFGRSVQHEVRQWGEIKKGYTHFADGDLVMAKITPCFENGKSAVVDQLTGGIGAGTTELHVFRQKNAVVLPRYALIYLKSLGFIKRGVPRMIGSAGQKRVPYDYFANSPFPLPPLAEQKRIVGKVDELMALCDRLEAQQQERQTRHAALARASLARFADAPTPANLDFLFHPSYTISPADLRKSIFTLAVQGKLVPQDPNDEPAETLNSKLPNQLRAIADKVGARFSSSIALVGDGDDLPAGWGVAAIQGIGITQTGTTPSKSESSFTGREIPFIKPGDIQGNEIDYENEGLSAEGLGAGRLIPKNSVLMVSIGGSIGKTAIVDRDVSCNQQINSVSPAECIEPRFILTAIRSGDFQSEVMNRAAQGTLPIISKGKWETIRIPIPPLAEQRRIVAKVNHLMTLVDQLEMQLAASRATAANLLEALVAELTTA